MATEKPMTMVERSQTSKWLSSKDISTSGSSMKNKATEELDIFLKGHKFSQRQANFIPSRSGSAPPSMEGSVAAVGNMLPVKDCSLISNPDSLGNALEDHKSEGKLFDPSYVANCSLEPNLDSKLPPGHLLSQIKNEGITSSSNGGTASLSTDEGLNRECSPEQASINLFDTSSVPKPGQNAAPSASLRKSLLALIQEDFPRTPSPVYNQSHLSSHATTEDSIDADVYAISSTVSSIDLSNQSKSTTCSTSVVETGALNIDACELISNDVTSENFLNLQNADGTQSLLEDSTCNKDAVLEDYVSMNGVMHPEERKLRASNVRRQKQEQYFGRNKLNQSLTRGYTYEVPGAGLQVVSQGMNHSQSYLGMLAYSHSQFSSLGMQSSMPSPGLTGPLYATPSPFMTSGSPLYPNFQPSGLRSPQYSLGGYALSPTSVLPYVDGYSSQGDLPLPFDAADLNGHATCVFSEGIPQACDPQNRNKIYGQYGLSLQPSHSNPFNMQYYPHSLGDAYPAAIQQNQLASRTLTEAQVTSLVSQQDSAVPAYLNYLKSQSPLHGSLTIPSSKSMGISGNSQFGDSSMGVMTQFRALSLGSPILPSSPRGGANPLSGQNKKIMPNFSSRDAGFSSGQRGNRNFDDPKKQSFLEELKSISSGKFELSDIAGRIVEFSIDQHGSRCIQLKLESCSAEEKESVFEELLPHALKLMKDVFGNYVIQKYLEHGSPDQRKKLADQLSGHIVPLSLQMYGCRVIQKALEVIELDQKTLLVQELDGHVMRCVHDQNGNHVIQKCIECIPVNKIHFIISAFQGQVPALSTHPYGCRVIQRVLEHCSDELLIQRIVDEILESVCVLAQDQYGNYVTQHILKRGKQHEKSQIISKLTGKIVQLSQHKYASNVVEKCLEYGDATEQEALIAEIIGQPSESDHLLTMMKDQFANYVIQKILDICNDRHREILLNHIKAHTDCLKKYTYGKHIVACYEQLSDPDMQ